MKHRFTTLDSFRGLFAFIVAIYHYKSAGPIGDWTLIQKGPHFVDFFFVLSGFIIYHNYADLTKGIAQQNFIKNRLLRLYPLHLFMLVVFLLMECAKFALYSYGVFKSPVFEKNNFTSFIVNVLFLQSFNITPLSWNYPSWSISAEIVAYIVFCISIVYIRKFSSGYRSVMFLGISLLSITIIRLIFNSFNIELTNNYSMLRCMFGFFIGCFTYEMYHQIAARSGGSQQFTLWEILTLSVSLLATMYLPEELNFVLPVFYAATILCFAFEKGKMSSWFTNKLFLTIGTLSYSIYMTHAAVAVVFEIILKVIKKDSPVVLTISLAVYLIAVYFISTFTYEHIEIGMRRRLKTLFEPKNKLVVDSTKAGV